MSVSTVSRALNNHPDIREETKKQVMEMIKKLNYMPNAMAKGLIQKKSYTIGLMIPEITDPFFSGIAHGVEEELSNHNYQCVYGNTGRDSKKEKNFISSAISRQYDGLILTPDHMDEEFISMLANISIPYVFLRRRTPEQLPMPFVDVDHYESACTAVRHLIEAGHRQIGLIGMSETSFVGQLRYQGYVDTLRANGIELEDKNVVLGGNRIEFGREAMGRLLEANPTITAVFAVNDLLGIGALEYLAEQQIAVPDQISLIGFDDLEYSRLHWIQLTTMKQPRKEMGRRAAQLVLNMIENKDEIPPSVLFDTQLLQRKTVGRLERL